FSSRRRHTTFDCDWSSDVCSSDLAAREIGDGELTPFLAEQAELDHQHRIAIARSNVCELAAEGDLVRLQVLATFPDAASLDQPEIGRASCRESVLISEGGGRINSK